MGMCPLDPVFLRHIESIPALAAGITMFTPIAAVG